jgi:predicted PurR-regulated permease PerM
MNKPDQISPRLRLIFFIGIGAALLLTVYYLRTVLGPFFLALVIAYVLDPVVTKMEAKRVPRSLATLLILLPFLALVVLALWFLIPFLFREIAGLVQNFPNYAENFRRLIVSWTHLEADTSVQELLQNGMDYLQEKMEIDTSRLVQPLSGLLFGLLSNTIAIITWTFGLFIVPVFSYYLLQDMSLIKTQAVSYFPPDYRESWVEFLGEIDHVISGFIRGQLMVCTILAVLYSVGLFFIGINYGLLAGIFTGYAFIVPYVGTIAGVILALILSFATFGVDYHLLLVAGWIALVQMIESYYITPKIVGGKVGLGVIEVILAILIAGNIFGFLGVVIAVPLAASFKVILKKLLAAYKNSRLFNAAPNAK